MEELKELAIAKFGNNNLILCDNAIYFITLRDDGGHHYEGRKVLDDLRLSQEEYEFDEFLEYDEYGNVVGVEYEIKVKGT